MMGLADRVGPWARRFQRAAGRPGAERRDDGADGRDAGRSAPRQAPTEDDDDALAAPERLERSGARFARRAVRKR
jgi:hypothetical protein